jgi:hypothetical protein
MCWLYTGTFGSFIGFSASLPLLAKEFPAVEALEICLDRPAGRRDQPGGNGLGCRPLERRASHCGSLWR